MPLAWRLTRGAAPLLLSAQTTITSVNAQLDTVDSITKDVGNMTTNAAALTSIVSSTIGSPLIKVAAFSYGVRRAMGQKREDEVRKRVKTQIKADKTARRATRKAAK